LMKKVTEHIKNNKGRCIVHHNLQYLSRYCNPIRRNELDCLKLILLRKQFYKKRNLRSAVRTVQDSYQAAMMRKMLKDSKAGKDNRLELVYGANCPPPYFYVEPATRICFNSKVCPWCFTRLRLLPIYSELLAARSRLKRGYRIAILTSSFDAGTPVEDMFFTRMQVHLWAKSLMTAQMVQPLPVAVGDFIGVKNLRLLIQVVPESKDYLNVFDKRNINHNGAFFFYKPKLALQFVADQIPWSLLYPLKSVEAFSAIYSSYKGKKLIRINKYKEK